MRRNTAQCLLAVLMAVSVIVIGPDVLSEIAKWGAPDTGQPVDATPTTAKRAIEFQTVPSSVAAVFPRDHARLLADGHYGELRAQLTKEAAERVGQRDDAGLARTLALLGEATVEAGDFERAELYYTEALTLYREANNVLGIAGVEMSLGIINLDKRRRAIAAGTNYDRLLLARWKLSHGKLFEAQQQLLDIIAGELAARRHNAAANAYRTLVEVFQKRGELGRAQQATEEALRLYARVGRDKPSLDLLRRLTAAGVEPAIVTSMRQQFEEDLSHYRRQQDQMARADDYNQLYRHFIAVGDRDRAWGLREKAADLARALPTDAQLRRRSDAIAMLYTSNSAVRDARQFLVDAEQHYAQVGATDRSERSRKYLLELR